MDIQKSQSGSKLTVVVSGRLDTVSSPQFQSSLNESLENVTELVIDFSKLDYISSAGLRVLLSTNKKMLANGSMVIKGANAVVKEVFTMTGFIDILTVEA